MTPSAGTPTPLDVLRDMQDFMVGATGEQMREMDAALSDVETLVEAAREVVQRHRRGCAVIHGNKPEGWTCLDTLSHAADPANAYAKEFRSQILAGERLCDPCRLRHALHPFAGDGNERAAWAT